MESIRIKATLLIFLFVLIFGAKEVNAQSQEAQQLVLNVEKLSQLKNILRDMKRGYTVISNGYNSVKNIAEGNFSLHEVFLDGLMLVSPEVKKYRRVADIISYQKNIIVEYKTAFNRFKSASNFSVGEIDYLDKVYQQLFKQSIDNLDELVMIITSSKLRMSDDERLQAIDKIFADTEDKLNFLRNFNREANILNMQRQREKVDVKTTQSYFGIN